MPRQPARALTCAFAPIPMAYYPPPYGYPAAGYGACLPHRNTSPLAPTLLHRWLGLPILARLDLSHADPPPLRSAPAPMAVPYGYRPPPQHYMRHQIAWAEAYDRRMPFMIPPYLPPDVARAFIVVVWV